MKKFVSSIVAAALTGVLLAACSLTGSGDEETQGSEIAPTGDPVVIASLDSIDGAEVYESDGVSFAVPSGMATHRTEDGETVQIFVYDASQTIEDVQVEDSLHIAVSKSGGATDYDVDEGNIAASSELARSGATDIEERPAEYAQWPYAVAVTGRRDEAPEEGGRELEFLSITTRSDGEAISVGLTLYAPLGTLEESWQYEVLRTVRPSS